MIDGTPRLNIPYWYEPMVDKIGIKLSYITASENMDTVVKVKWRAVNNTESALECTFQIWRSHSPEFNVGNTPPSTYQVIAETTVIVPTNNIEVVYYDHPPDNNLYYYGVTIKTVEGYPLHNRIWQTLSIDVGRAPGAPGREPPSPPSEFRAYDYPNDQGWKVKGNWTPQEGQLEFLFCREKDAIPSDDGHYVEPEWIDATEIARPGTLLRRTDVTSAISHRALPGLFREYWVRTYDPMTDLASERTIQVEDVASRDNCPPPAVQNFHCEYNRQFDAFILKWDEIPRSEEPNMGGYWIYHWDPTFGDYIPINNALLTRNRFVYKRSHGQPPIGTCAIRAEDRSGNLGPMQEIEIEFPSAILSNSPNATAFNNGRRLVRVPNTEFLHLTYGIDGFIMYANSPDGGQKWDYRTCLNNGHHPAIAINEYGLPWIIYLKDNDVCYTIQDCEKNWRCGTLFDGDSLLIPGPPSIVLGPPSAFPEMRYAFITFPVYDLNINASFVFFAKLHDPQFSSQLYLAPVDQPNYSLSDSFASVSLTPGDIAHCVWQRGSEILYSTASIEPGQWENIIWEGPRGISDPDAVSKHPSTETFGDMVFMLWSDYGLGEIIQTGKVVYDEIWMIPQNVSNTQGFSDYPQMSTPKIMSWQELLENGKWEIMANVMGNLVNFSETPDSNSSYAHINALLPDPFGGSKEPIVYSAWSEETNPDTLYEVRTRRYKSSSSDVSASHSIEGGEEQASFYCQQRDGYINYQGYSFDYGNSLLQYELKYLNPQYYYKAEAIVYSNRNNQFRENIQLDTAPSVALSFSALKPETIRIALPKNIYRDNKILLKIRKELGAYASLVSLKLYPYEVLRREGGGGQSGGISKLPIEPRLFQNVPNPFINKTKITYQFPIEGRVTLRIYDIAGKLVRTLINERQMPGVYNIIWDGKDKDGRDLPSGIYFYRLEIPNFETVKKTTLLR